MKKIIFILAFLFVLPLAAQRQKATLFLKDGTELKGLARINGFSEIKFRKNKKSKKQFYNSNLVKKLIIRQNDIDTEYHYKTVKGKKSVKLLELVEKGRVTLYRDLKQGYSPGVPVGGYGSGGMMMGGGSYSISNYYVTKKRADFVTHLGTKGSIFSKNFKKAASDYFKDCSKLVKKIQNKEYKKRHIVEIIEFYNEYCAE